MSTMNAALPATGAKATPYIDIAVPATSAAVPTLLQMFICLLHSLIDSFLMCNFSTTVSHNTLYLETKLKSSSNRLGPRELITAIRIQIYYWRFAICSLFMSSNFFERLIFE